MSCGCLSFHSVGTTPYWWATQDRKDRRTKQCVLTAAPRSVEGGRRAEAGGSGAAAQTAGTKILYPAGAHVHKLKTQQNILISTFGNNSGSSPRERRRWSAIWRSSGCTFPWIHCTTWMAHCTRNTKEPLWGKHTKYTHTLPVITYSCRVILYNFIVRTECLQIY